MQLYDYQKKALAALRSGSILNGEVGTGKSCVSIAFYFTKICDGTIEPDLEMPNNSISLYIITTARKRDSGEWNEELSRFGLSDDIEFNRERNNCAATIIIDSWNNIKKYESVKNAFFIFDEQRVSGYSTWAKTFIKIAKNNRWILLSATPGDTWMDYIPVFVANGFYKNKGDFVRQHVVYKSFMKYPVIDSYQHVDQLMKLRDTITVYMKCQRTTIRHDNIIDALYNKDLYFQMVNHRWNPYKNQPIENVSELCALLWCLINTDTSRIDIIERLLLENKRCIIFYNFDYELEIIRSICSKNHLTLKEWNGKKHEAVPECSAWVYATQYASGAEAWNCITTNVIIFYSDSYSYKAMTQACGRIDRINTPYTDLYYYHIQTKAPIDRAKQRCLIRKKDFNAINYFKKGEMRYG